MQEILLVTGIHDAENEVTKDVATSLTAELLKRGYSPRIVQVPEEYTLYGQAREAIHNLKKTNISEAGHTGMAFLKKLSDANRTAFIIDLHAQDTGKITKKPSKAKIRKIENNFFPPFDFYLYEYKFSKYSNHRCFQLELPSISSTAKEEHMQLARALDPRSVNEHDKSYFFRKANLLKTRRTNILTPRNIQRLAHLIHTEIQTVKGNFRAPRKPMYQTKTNSLGLSQKVKQARARLRV